jgi:peptidoglycan/LPS O-acetylase OafA/YrhL
VAALRNSTLVSKKRSLSISCLLVPPLILVVLSLDLGFPVAILVTAVLIGGLDRLLRVNPDQRIGKATLRLWLVAWLIEVSVPIALHFSLRSRLGTERVALLVFGITLLAGLLVTFLVLAPDHRKGARPDGSA